MKESKKISETERENKWESARISVTEWQWDRKSEIEIENEREIERRSEGMPENHRAGVREWERQWKSESETTRKSERRNERGTRMTETDNLYESDLIQIDEISLP